ncbi:MAG: ATP-binding cassette domain-containing protein [Candidatus Rokubacteria bacterium]|nr:ATP-binding cassette domain-containing protein [Candidatus Rokubacteria bacterium]
MATVETRAVRKHFGDVPAVDGVDLATKEGEFLVLLGPSGCGKTTLLRMIAGLELPTAGEILIGGQVVNDLPPRARKIAMVFQSYALYPHMTVAKNIAFPLKAQGVPREAIPTKVEWAASLFGIEKLLHRKPRELSGGERQRVALARAVVREPAVFLLDEPLSNLDAKLRASAREELQQFQRRIGTTTIYVTHDQIEAMGLGDRIAVMQGGKVRQIGTPPEVYDEPADTFVAGFLGSPPMNIIETPDGLVGFRPEHFLPREAHADRPGLTALRFRVTRVEYLGADRLLYGILEGKFPDAKVIARLPSTVTAPVEPGKRYEFAVQEKDLKFFDAGTGLRTRPRPL